MTLICTTAFINFALVYMQHVTICTFCSVTGAWVPEELIVDKTVCYLVFMCPHGYPMLGIVLQQPWWSCTCNCGMPWPPQEGDCNLQGHEGVVVHFWAAKVVAADPCTAWIFVNVLFPSRSAAKICTFCVLI